MIIDLRAAWCAVRPNGSFQTLMGSDSLVFSSSPWRGKYRQNPTVLSTAGAFRC